MDKIQASQATLFVLLIWWATKEVRGAVPANWKPVAMHMLALLSG